MFKKLSIVALIVLSSVMFIDIVDAKGGRSGGGFSSRSSSRSSGSRSSSWGSKKATSSPSRSSTTTKSKAKTTPAQKKAYEKASSSGKAFTSKASAQKDFKSKFASQTKPGGKYASSYKTKPTTRPSHIPQSTNVNGTTVNINYNVGHGGYGYMNTLGAFIMYDMMSDQIMMNRMMTQQGYYVGPAPRGGSGAFGVIAIIVVLAVAGGIVIAIVTKD